MLKYRHLTPAGKFIVILAIICGISVIYSIANRHQSASDCSLVETYDDVSKKCILKSASQYADEIDNIESARIEANTEAKRRNGTLCIPAAEAKNYIGVNGCVRMIVQHYYIESYGWAWLDAGNESSDFSIAALGKGIITRNDAEYYLGKIISVRGTIELYDGAPEIKITSKNAIFDIAPLEEKAKDNQQLINNVAKNASCHTLESARRACEQNDSMCSLYQMYKGQFGEQCKNYTPSESTSAKRAKCFDEKIKSARTKTQKDAVYQQCQNP